MRDGLIGAALEAPPPLDIARMAVFADLDGTLAKIRPRPDDVGPDPHRDEILGGLAGKLGGALAIVSGRSLEDLDRILGGRVPAIAAVHGLVRRRADRQLIEAVSAPVSKAVLDALKAFQAQRPGLLIEDKGPSVALHFRAAPEAAAACEALARRLAQEAGLVVQAGDMVVELRAPGPTKGEAVEAFMQEPPFAGRTPIFIGDDLTDENGFIGAERLGGFGVIVGSRRPTRARFALKDVEAALEWLSAAALA